MIYVLFEYMYYPIDLNNSRIYFILPQKSPIGYTCLSERDNQRVIWSAVRHGYQIWPQSVSDWPQMGQIREIFRSDSVHFGAVRQNVLNLIWKFSGFVPFGANLTHFGAKSGNRELNIPSETIYQPCSTSTQWYTKKKLTSPSHFSLF